MMRKILLPIFLAFYALALMSCESKQAVIPNKVHCVNDLGHKKVGVQIGNTADIYATDFGGDTAKIDVDRYTKLADAIQALKQQKLDCVILDEQPALAFAAKNGDIKIVKEEFTLEDYALCLKKGNTELLDKINQALAKLKENGTIHKIITNYIGTDEEKGTMPYEKQDVERKGKLIVATNAEFPPYEYVDNGKITGIGMDIMQAVCDELGYQVKVTVHPFAHVCCRTQTAVVCLENMEIRLSVNSASRPQGAPKTEFCPGLICASLSQF